MKIYKAKDYADMSRKAANIISAQIIMKPECVLGLATGSTPVGLYKQLVEWYKKVTWIFQQLRLLILMSIRDSVRTMIRVIIILCIRIYLIM